MSARIQGDRGPLTFDIALKDLGLLIVQDSHLEVLYMIHLTPKAHTSQSIQSLRIPDPNSAYTFRHMNHQFPVSFDHSCVLFTNGDNKSTSPSQLTCGISLQICSSQPRPCAQLTSTHIYKQFPEPKVKRDSSLVRIGHY